MHFLRNFLAATAVAAFFPVAAHAQAGANAEQQFSLLQTEQQAGAALQGRELTLDIDLAASDVVLREEGGKQYLHYRMASNQVAEGWSWQPMADPAREDYYRFKYLPLQSLTVERGEYTHEDKIGEAQKMRIVWRYDYFLAFDNLYDFYPRRVDDEAGFDAELPPLPRERVALRARVVLGETALSESTTFWKAIHAQPRDLTLKKRYFIGKLQLLEAFDRQNGEMLCRIERGGDGRCRRQP